MIEFRFNDYKKLYNLTYSDIASNGGEDLLALYDKDVYVLVNRVFGEKGYVFWDVIFDFV